MQTGAHIAVLELVAEGTFGVTSGSPGGETALADPFILGGSSGGGRGRATRAAGTARSATHAAGSARAAGATIARGSANGGARFPMRFALLRGKTIVLRFGPRGRPRLFEGWGLWRVRGRNLVCGNGSVVLQQIIITRIEDAQKGRLNTGGVADYAGKGTQDA